MQHEAGSKSGKASPDRCAKAQRLCFMLNLAVTAGGSLSITLALAAITPKGRKLAGKVWEWVTGLFGKKPSSCPRELSINVVRETAKGDRFGINIEYRQAPAIGGSPSLPANPQPAQLLLPPQGATFQPSRTAGSTKVVKPTALAKSRHPRRRVIGRLQSSTRRGRTR